MIFKDRFESKLIFILAPPEFAFYCVENEPCALYCYYAMAVLRPYRLNIGHVIKYFYTPKNLNAQ